MDQTLNEENDEDGRERCRRLGETLEEANDEDGRERARLRKRRQ